MDHNNGAGFFSAAFHNIFRNRANSSTNAGGQSRQEPNSNAAGSSVAPALRDNSGQVMDNDREMTPLHDEPPPAGHWQAMEEDIDMHPMSFAPNDAHPHNDSMASLVEQPQPLHHLHPVAGDPPSLPPTRDEDARSDTSMPSLQTVSDSSSEGGEGMYDDMSQSERDARDVEMMPDLETVSSDDDSAWTDDDHSDMPPLIPADGRRTRRRVEVEEVEDPDNRHATGSGQPSQQAPNPLPHPHPHPPQPNAHARQPPLPHFHFPAFQGLNAPHPPPNPGQGPTLPSLRTLFEPLFAEAFAQADARARAGPQGEQEPAPGHADGDGVHGHAHAHPPGVAPGGHGGPDMRIPMVSVTLEVPIYLPANPRPQGQAGEAQAHPPPPQQGLPPFNFLFSNIPPQFGFAPNSNGAANNAPPQPHPTHAHGHGPQVPPNHHHHPNQGPNPTANPAPLTDFLTMPELLGMLGVEQPQDGAGGWAAVMGLLFGLGMGSREEDREDPKRARRLVSGLEEVGEGMVRRMKRVDDGEEAGGGGCAICWESLMGEDQTGGTPAGEDAEMSDAAPAAQSQSEPPVNSEGSATSSAEGEPAEKPLPKIVSLPCSHVFHSACLLPWFTRPKQTTCPTCRFNIDPDNLTYEPRARAAPAQTAPAAQSAPAQPAPAQPAPQPTPPTAEGPAPAQNANLGAGPAPTQGATPNRNGAAGAAPQFPQGFFPFPLPPMTQAADGSWYAWAPPFPPFAPATAAGHAATPPNAPTNGAGTAQRREKRPWTLPPPPGPTLRQRVEQRERERGLRCDDVSCGLGPSDEDPEPPNSNEKRVGIRPLGEHGTRACPHVFHGACLVSAERVAGWGQEDSEEKEEKEGMVEVSCPVCRAVGAVPREDWEAGVRALE